MLAVVKEHTGPGFAIKDVPMPVCREDDVIVKVKSVGFCGSDGPILAGTREVPFPLIPGHEFAGDIVEVGRKAEGWKVGDLFQRIQKSSPEMKKALATTLSDRRFCIALD